MDVFDSPVFENLRRAAGEPRHDGRRHEEVEPRCLADWAGIVNDRLNRRASREDKQAVAGQIGDWLMRRGRILLDTLDGLNPTPYVIADDGAALPLSDDLLLVRATFAQTGLNPSEPAFRWLMEDLCARATRDGIRARLERWTAWRGDALYVSCGPSRVVVARPGEPLRTIGNGEDGVLFAADGALPEWTPTEPVSPMSLRAFRCAFEAPPEAAGYSAEAQSVLLAVYLIALLAMRPLPILAFIGAHASGKTAPAKAVAKLLRGDQGDVTAPTLAARDLKALAVRLPYVAIDNLDDMPDGDLLNELASVATGANVDLRRLYTDATVFSAPARAAVAMTTRTAAAFQGQRHDLRDRCLPIFLGDLADERRADINDLMREVLERRDAVLSWLAVGAANLTAHLDKAPAGLPGSQHYPSFNRLVYLFLASYRRADEAEPVLRAWRQAQQLAVADLDPLTEAILNYLPEGGLRGNAAAIVSELQNRGADLPYLGGGKAIARKLREARAALNLANITIQESRDEGDHTIFHIYRR